MNNNGKTPFDIFIEKSGLIVKNGTYQGNMTNVFLQKACKSSHALKLEKNESNLKKLNLSFSNYVIKLIPGKLRDFMEEINKESRKDSTYYDRDDVFLNENFMEHFRSVFPVMSNKFTDKDYKEEDRKIIKNLLISNEIEFMNSTIIIIPDSEDPAAKKFNELVENSKMEIRDVFLGKLKQKFNKFFNSNISFDQLKNILSVLDLIKESIFFDETKKQIKNRTESNFQEKIKMNMEVNLSFYK